LTVACALIAFSSLAAAGPLAAQENEPAHPLGSRFQDFGGIRTFLRAPHVDDLQKLQADVAVLGVPFDEGTTLRPGARYGPREIREMSLTYGWHRLQGAFYYIDGGRVALKGKRWADCGDVEIVPTQVARTFDNITEAVRAIAAKKALPVILGGDHAISFPAIRGLDGPPLMVVHFDAHLDTWDYGPEDLGHAGWVLHSARLPFVKRLVQIGMRGLANDEGAVKSARDAGSVIITAEELRRYGIKAALAKIPRSERIYVSIDIDVLDPSIAPGTGTPEVDGLSFDQLRQILVALPSKGRLAGMDVVEVTPYYDPGGITALAAARLVIDLVGAALP
jgi:agmatinase